MFSVIKYYIGKLLWELDFLFNFYLLWYIYVMMLLENGVKYKEI